MEGIRVAVEDARFNAEKNGIRNAYFIEGEVEEVLKDWKTERPDQMILLKGIASIQLIEEVLTIGNLGSNLYY